MNLEELVQRLDDANPWPREAIENIYSVPLSIAYSSKHITSYGTGPLSFEEGLILSETELRTSNESKEVSRLILTLSDNASCFPLERIKKAHPDLYPSPFGGPRGDSLHEEDNYWTKRPWGNISFGFKLLRPDCLSSVTYIPKKWE